ncbi:unnamed protein product [Symbiodinium sp. CCMP2456]|nr:unnamed protein product [Symbiodinium sp. CCMP2456]
MPPERTWAGSKRPHKGKSAPCTRKRRKTESPDKSGEEVPPEVKAMLKAVHQFGLVGGEDYDSKEERLQQLLDRLPADSGPAIVFANTASQAQAASVVDRSRRQAPENICA